MVSDKIKNAVSMAKRTIEDGDNDRAREFVQDALTDRNLGTDALFKLAQVFVQLGSEDDLRTVLKRLRDAQPDLPNLVARGRVLRMLDDPRGAIGPMKRPLKLNSRSIEAHMALSMAHYEAQELDAAVAIGRQGLAIQPSNLLLWLNTLRAQAALDIDALELDELDALIAAGPGRAPAHRLRLNVLKRLGLKARLRDAIDQFAEDCPAICDVDLEHATLDLLEGDLDGAEAKLTRSLVLETASVDRIMKLGQVYGAASKLEDLDALIQHAAGLPPNAENFALLARLRQLAKDHVGTMDAIESSLSFDASQVGLSGLLMEELIQIGRGKDALERRRRMPDTVRRHPEILVKAANANWGIAKPERAIKVLKRPESNTDPLLQQHLAQYLALTGRVEEAKERLDYWQPKNRSEAATKSIAQAIVARWEYDFLTMERHTLAAIEADPNRYSVYGLLAHAKLVLFDPVGAFEAQAKMAEMIKAHGQPPRQAREIILWAMAEEMMLDLETTSKLASAARTSPQKLKKTALAEVEKGYDQIGPALALMSALRQCGDLKTSPSGKSDIPKFIHQYWEGHPIPQDLKRAMDQMAVNNPDYEYRLYDRSMAQDIIGRDGKKETTRAFQLARHAAERADIFRLVLLNQEGGIYVDVDDICRSSFSQLLPAGKETVLYQEHYGTIANNFIAACPNNPVLEEALKSAVEETLANSAVSLWLRTGPGLITRNLAAHLCTKNLDTSHVLIHKHSEMISSLLICAPFSYKMDERHWIKARKKVSL